LIIGISESSKRKSCSRDEYTKEKKGRKVESEEKTDGINENKEAN
jgi:hypothetical protein